jgi:hypothetical protein
MSNTTRFRPDGLEASTGGGGSKWLGYCAVGILDWQDKSSDFDWADVYLVGTLKVSDSQYTQEFKLAGSFDKEPNGNIKTCTLLKRLYWLFDAIGFDGGPNVTGEMVDADGNAIDLVNHFNINHVTDPLNPTLDYTAYIYKEPGRKDPSKSYTTVFPKLTSNTAEGKKDLEGYINFMKSKNLIKEVQEGVVPPVANGGISATKDDSMPF